VQRHLTLKTMAQGKLQIAAIAFAIAFSLGSMLNPAPLLADQLPGEALTTFPADTLQVSFTDLATLRTLSVYPQIRERILNRQLRAFEDFLRPMGMDAEKDIDEIMLGWRGEMVGPSGYLGLAAGRFQPELVQKYIQQTGVPVTQYDSADLYPFGAGGGADDLYFTILDISLAAFGRLGDLKAMLDARQGSINALNSNSDFVNWQGELEGTSPQWGILNGKSAANMAGAWLAPSGQKTVDLGSLARSIRALLYRIQWDTGFTANLFMVCDTPESAAGFDTLLGLLKQASKQPPSSGGVALPPILQKIESHRDGDRLELDVSGPPEMLDQIMPAGGS
jgi:hypothetical protein